jgi:hypothetical protein
VKGQEDKKLKGLGENRNERRERLGKILFLLRAGRSRVRKEN